MSRRAKNERVYALLEELVAEGRITADDARELVAAATPARPRRAAVKDWRMWLFSLTNRRHDFTGPVAGLAGEVQPDVVKLTDSGVRKLLLRIDGGPISLELVMPDAQAFLDEVWACAKWVQHGDVAGR